MSLCEALAHAAERCGDEYKRFYDHAVVAVAGGDCKNVISIRDEQALRDVCLPAIASESCGKILFFSDLYETYDPACDAQLQRRDAGR